MAGVTKAKEAKRAGGRAGEWDMAKILGPPAIIL